MNADRYTWLSRALGTLPIETTRELEALQAVREVVGDAYRAATGEQMSAEVQQVIRSVWIAGREWGRLLEADDQAEDEQIAGISEP